MVQENIRSSTAAANDNDVREEAGETILDFLWSSEAPAAAAQQGTLLVPGYAEPLKETEPPPVPLAQPVSKASAGKPLPQGLKDALEQYSTWLNSWSGQS